MVVVFQLLVTLEPAASEHLLLGLCSHVTCSHVTRRDDGAGTDKMDASLLVDVYNFLLLHDNKLVFDSDTGRIDMPATSRDGSNKVTSSSQSEHSHCPLTNAGMDSVLLPELISTLTNARLETLSKAKQARLFLASLNLSSCISRGHCPVMKQSVVECREFAASFEAFLASGSSVSSLVTVSSDDVDCDIGDFPRVIVTLCDKPSETVAEKVSDILIRLWSMDVRGALWVLLTGESEAGSSNDRSVSPHECAFLVGLFLEWRSLPTVFNAATQTLSVTLRNIVAPFAEQLSTWLERGKDPVTATGPSLEEIDRVVFTIDERLKGYVGKWTLLLTETLLRRLKKPCYGNPRLKSLIFTPTCCQSKMYTLLRGIVLCTYNFFVIYTLFYCYITFCCMH